MAGAGTEVHVGRDGDGTIRVAAGPFAGADFTQAVLDVSGAVLLWPVLAGPATLPVAEVYDVGRTQQWLWAVYGERVAAAVHTCAAAGGPTSVRVTACLTDLAGAAARLGFGHWAARWWPTSYTDGIAELEADVLGLELAALTHRCQQLFDDFGDQPDDCAAELIEEHRAALDPLTEWWRSAAQPAGAASHLESVLRMVDDAADGAGLDWPELRRLRAALDQRRPAGTPADPGALFAHQDGYALAAGVPPTAGGRVIARGPGTNDWRRYPPGFVDAAEDAVSWTARALGAQRQIEVEAVAHNAAPAADPALVAEVQVNGGRPHRVPLARRDDLWAGRATLDLAPDPALALVTPMPPLVEVGVLLPGFDPGPSLGGRADRDAIRALARRRLADTVRPQAFDTFAGPFLAEIVAAAATSEDY
ncbi:hypothetical protein EES39_21800 [Streptomyces sp. ADI92-24]|uniref:hypothetical protein n=1 Tax=unclassified Streptomyces TaxID=2593676 RepID=UPI000F48F626|nr:MULTISPECIES: hypothetical protein [unclassified Streptomyces]MCX4769308.1 hypothetical protein [Streptomyces sp. NBC_01285]ROQ76538.1 hypothetical protein EDD95_2996 [Streptomyces sp. CEV 2-1]RPK41885.1 hypothetical protein EES39_21800 [Streptomyces sp. ADI92-24]